MSREIGQIVLACLGMLIPMCGGCAGTGKAARPAWSPLATFGVAEDLPRIVVYGSLAQYLPRFNPTPALDEFLYGPSEPAATLLRCPQGLAKLNDLLLVCDQGHFDIIGIDLASGRENTWQDRDYSPRCPVAISVGADGLVYVADTTLRAVLVYLPTGGFVEQLTPSVETDRLFRPCSLLIDGSILYVGNVGEHRIDRWSLAERRWLPPLVPPPGRHALVAPTGLAMTRDDVLLVADTVQGRVFRMAPEGKWLRPIGSPGRQQGQFVRPKQVCCTPSGLVCVTDAGRQSVLVFTSEGDYIAEVDENQESWQGFAMPSGVLSLPAGGLAMLMREGRPMPEPLPDEWVIVTDSLSAVSLNVLGVFLPHREEATTHAGQ